MDIEKLRMDLVDKNGEKFYTRVDLLKMGFSEKMITSDLPKAIIKNKKSVWRALDVDLIIESDEFKKKLEISNQFTTEIELKQKKEVDTLIERAKNATVRVKKLSSDELRSRTKESQKKRFPNLRKVIDSNRISEFELNKWEHSYIRHVLTSYDKEWYSYFQKPGNDEAYFIWLKRVEDAIVKIYPTYIRKSLADVVGPVNETTTPQLVKNDVVDEPGVRIENNVTKSVPTSSIKVTQVKKEKELSWFEEAVKLGYMNVEKQLAPVKEQKKKTVKSASKTAEVKTTRSEFEMSTSEIDKLRVLKNDIVQKEPPIVALPKNNVKENQTKKIEKSVAKIESDVHWFEQAKKMEFEDNFSAAPNGKKKKNFAKNSNKVDVDSGFRVEGLDSLASLRKNLVAEEQKHEVVRKVSSKRAKSEEFDSTFDWFAQAFEESDKLSNHKSETVKNESRIVVAQKQEKPWYEMAEEGGYFDNR